MTNKQNKIRRRSLRKLDYLVALLLSFFIVFIWQLYRAPISVTFLKPYIIKALNYNDEEYLVGIDDVHLEFARSIKPIKIIANNFYLKKKDETVVVKAPRTTVSFSVRALIRGIISPSSIILDDPSVDIYTNYTVANKEETEIKTLSERKIEYYLTSFEKFLKKYNSNDLSYPESYIDYIKINNAEFEFHEVDLGRKWAFGEANFIFERGDGDFGFAFQGSYLLEDTIVPFSLDINYHDYTQKIDVGFGFSELVPSSVLESIVVDEDKKDIFQLNMPFSGKIETVIDFAEILKNRRTISKSLDTAISDFNFKLEAGKGYIAFSEDEKYDYHISSLFLEGNIDSGLNKIKITDSKLKIDEEEALISLDITGVKKLLLENSLEDLKVSLTTELNNFRFEKLSQYWPRYIAELAWDWCRVGLYKGLVSKATFKFDFEYSQDNKKILFKDLSGRAEVVDASLDYLEGMPHAHNVYGVADFYNDRIDIKVEKGTSEGIEVIGGTVLLYDLDKEDNFISIKLKGNSEIPNFINFIDNKPLEFAKEMGIDANTLKGDAEVDLDLSFEFRQDLKNEDVKVYVSSKLKNVEILDIIKNKTIKAEKMDLVVENKYLLAFGEVELEGVGLNMKWLKEFDNDKYENQYQLSFILNDALKEKLSLDYEILKEPYLSGDSLVKANIIEKNNKDLFVEVDIDLKDTIVDYSFIDFQKEAGEKASLIADVELLEGNISSLKNILLTKKDFELNTNINFDNKGSISLIDVPKIRSPKIDAKGRVEITKLGEEKLIKVNISGQSYDVSWFLDRQSKEEKEQRKREKESNLTEESDSFMAKLDNTEIFIAVDSLWTNKKFPITNFAGSAKTRKGIGLDEVKMVGNYSNNKEESFKFDYVPHNEGEHKIDITSSNAGLTFKVLRIYEYMEKGALYISGIEDSSGRIVGHAKIRNFNIKNTKLLYSMLSIASFTGIVDMLKGDGIVFSHLDAPFDYQKGVLEFKDVKTFGSVVGITSNGFYNFDSDFVNVGGMVAPAYAVNKLLGSIPLVGNLLSGGDGTVFAVDYKIKGNTENPSINVNPLSAISPNSIKELFREE